MSTTESKTESKTNPKKKKQSKKKQKTKRKTKKNTMVRRCVGKLKKKHKIGAAIAICQHSTRQGYKTGRRLQPKRNRTRKIK